MKRVRMEKDYQVADRDIALTIVIGNAQIGISCVKLGDTELARGDIAKKVIGNGRDLAGKTLAIKTVVADVNDLTNRTNVTYQLRGGTDDQDYGLNAVVEENGDSAIYYATIHFKR
ncbi:MAG TPA: hypothetical protein VN285_09085 [Candidatus Deferrimicrobium sp.]|nr:hypothetical protein [Candidatus Deferrimicrobium sp.]